MITTIDFFDEKTGTWQAVDAVYPIQFTQRLDRELDSGEFNSLGDDRKKAYSIIRIVIGDTADSADTFYFYANSSQKWQPSEVNQNGLRLIEPTKVLQGRFIDGLSVVQPITGTPCVQFFHSFQSLEYWLMTSVSCGCHLVWVAWMVNCFRPGVKSGLSGSVTFNS